MPLTQSRTLPKAAAARHRPGLLARLVLAATVLRERQRLARLDRHLLADIGLTAEAARHEAERPLWDAPERWRR